MDPIAALESPGVVPVLEIPDVRSAAATVQALVDGGLPCAEITFRTAHAEAAIGLVARTFPGVLIGAGTVLSTEQVDRAVGAGARFIVCPGFNPLVVEHCLTRSIPVLPGVCTPTEIEMALARGVTVLKFFPAEAAGGVQYLRAIRGPPAGPVRAHGRGRPGPEEGIVRAIDRHGRVDVLVNVAGGGVSRQSRGHHGCPVPDHVRCERSRHVRDVQSRDTAHDPGRRRGDRQRGVVTRPQGGSRPSCLCCHQGRRRGPHAVHRCRLRYPRGPCELRRTRNDGHPLDRRDSCRSTERRGPARTDGGEAGSWPPRAARGDRRGDCLPCFRRCLLHARGDRRGGRRSDGLVISRTWRGGRGGADAFAGEGAPA